LDALCGIGGEVLALAVCIEAVEQAQALDRRNVRGQAPDDFGADQFLDDVTKALRKRAGP
jgi:hypothetical protein